MGVDYTSIWHCFQTLPHSGTLKLDAETTYVIGPIGERVESLNDFVWGGSMSNLI